VVTSAILLTALAVALAWPVPIALAEARWVRRQPAGALALWQIIGLSGGVTLLAAELSVAAIDRDGAWPTAVAGALAHPGRGGITGSIGLLAFAATAIWLVGVLVTSTLRVAAGRRRHRMVLDLLARRYVADVPAGVSVLTHPATAAYSVPGRHPRIVVSEGACESFSRSQLTAVVEHERAHLRQHHDLVVQPFVAWQKSFPFLRGATSALRAVELLTEFLADDAVRTRLGDDCLAEALDVMAALHHDVAPRRTRLATTRDVGDPRDLGDPRDVGDPRDLGDPRDVGDPRDPGEFR
jgi:Zn-dependent protease with chaperone function